MKGGGLIAGGLLAVIALIIYEQYVKNSVKAAIPNTGLQGANVTILSEGGTLGPITETPAPGQLASSPAGPTPSPLTVAAQSLPKFSEGVDPSVVDFGVSPSFNGTEWTCPGGDIPYYDPATQTVYCVLPGLRVSITPVIGDDLTESIMSGGVL